MIALAAYLWLQRGFAVASAASLRPADTATSSRINEAYGKLPLSFEENCGQTNSTIKFLARGSNSSLLLGPTEVTLMIRGKDGSRSNRGDARQSLASLRMKLIGSNSSAQIEGFDTLPGRANYLIGNDPKRWRVDIPTYAKVRYRKIYPGIDLIYYGNQQKLEYDFVVAPLADPNIIKLAFESVKHVRLDSNGDLVLLAENGEVRHRKPAIYQESNGEKQNVTGQYVLHNNNEVGFKIGNYDRNQPLIIDPVLLYSSLGIGGESIAVDLQGNAYVIGTTTSANFPTVNPIQKQRASSPDSGNSDIYIAKLNSSGTDLIYSTYLGGDGNDFGYGIALDAQNNIYVTGRTASNNFPGAEPVNASTFFKTVNGGGKWNAINPVPGGGTVRAVAVDPKNPATIYIAVLIQNQQSLFFKTTDGGSNWTVINNNLPSPGFSGPFLIIDPVNTSTLYVYFSNAIYKTTDGGATWKASISLSDGLKDFVIDPVNPSTLYIITGQNTLTPQSILKSIDGGDHWQVINNGLDRYPLTTIAVDPVNHNTLYLASQLSIYKSTDGGVNWKSVFNDVPGHNVFSLAIDPITSTTIYAATPKGVFKSIDGGDNWVISNNGLPTTDGFEPTVRLKIDPINPSTIYAAASSYGSGNGVYRSIDGGSSWSRVVDGLSNADVNLLALDPSNPSTLYTSAISDGNDAFVTKLNAAGSAIVYSVYLAGNHDDYGVDLAVDRDGNAYIVGTAESDNFPITAGAFQPKLGNGGDIQRYDAFVTKLNASGAISYSSYFGGRFEDYGNAVAIDAGSNIYITGQTSSNDLPTINALQTHAGSVDAFVAKIDPSQSGTKSFIYATHLGGDTSEGGTDIAADAMGNAYVLLSSVQIPGVLASSPTVITGAPITPGAFQSKPGAGYLAKLNAAGSALIFSTYLGSGTGQLGHPVKSDRPEYFYGLGLDVAGNIYITGYTRAFFFPVTPGAFQPTISSRNVCDPYGMPCSDAVIMKLNASGSALAYSSFLGGSYNDLVRSIAIDQEGNVYLTGGTGSRDFPVTPGAFQLTDNYGFITKLSPDNRSTNVASVSAASFTGPAVASESIVAAFGSGLANAIQPAGSVLTDSLDDVSLLVRDSAGSERSAPLFFLSPDQINFQLPPGTAIGRSAVSITYKGAKIAAGSVEVAPVAPGVFAANANGNGVAAAVVFRVKSDGSQSYEPVAQLAAEQKRFVPIPIDLGPESDQVVLVLFGTGWRFRSSESTVRVAIGGLDLPVLFAGKQGDFVGLDQINVLLPRSLAGHGEIDLIVTADGKMANTVKVSVK